MTDTVLYAANGKTADALFAVFLPSISAISRLVPVWMLLMIAVPGMVQAEEVCASSARQIGVRYEQKKYDSYTHKTISRVMELWRNDDRVLHVYPGRGLAEQWDHPGHGALHLTTWFDEDAHGIEYMPEDIGSYSDPHRWSEKWQLISDHAMQTLQLNRTSGHGCKLMRELIKNTPDRQITLEWNVPLQLLTRYSVKTKDGNQTWVAKEIVTDLQKVQQVFDRRTAYKTTDYIDIGDNESDSFLRKMIHLGFLSQQAFPRVFSLEGE